MDSGQYRAIRDFAAFGAALATLAVLYLLLEMEVILSLVVAIIVFVGMFFILNPKSIQQIAESRIMNMRSRSTGSMAGFRVKLSNMQNMSSRLDDAGIRDHLLDISELSKDIALAVERSPNSPEYIIARLDYAYTLLQKLLGRYIGLSHSPEARDQRHAESLADQIDRQILDPLEQAIRRITAEVEQHNMRVDISSIDSTVQNLEALLKAEGIV